MSEPTSTAAFSDDGFSPAAVGKALYLLAVVLFVMTPLVATVLGGFKSLGELRVNPFGLPSVWEWSNYADILLSKRYWQLLSNSFVIATLTVVLTLICASMAAFVFAHLHFFGRDMLLNYLTMGLLFPAATAILPIFIKVRDLGLLDSHLGVVLPQVAFALAMSILLLRRFFKDLPTELLEAALVDGCSYPKFFRYVTLPLSRPILATVGTITFVHSWNAYLIPLVMLNSDRLYPWPLGIMVYQGEYSTEWHLILAFITLTILPTIILFLFAQKHIVAGLTAGAVKG
ncbi:Thiamine ABC transporter ATP-binding protein [Bosea sp. 62]|uniref:carbohydrate ABC transporter permease n=1 Tax=unclassified Bosea (in: a-proteobacteria) TaxID=2653178 RepID=UPI00125512F5|nr:MULTISPECIES: carbohydrate ABC transporter permease [unclassified Bosea (in: a-proteobacteria)]CAD5251482.1 Thiamine ABC transporter ATP-binding protein [Bosea sp. 7B]CAD5280497.1 Thiamine ABC transporter ATP-binding protein [Bosea sp. 21B]CAD5281609.1 Thiamine ABC transporter ATP-binding protein [Bosea sp. 46]VVT59424.1 Carbohydrate ABC transporter membrane protein 2, CUT1 family [Bosea sp. EC-HK365B]VXB28491.1 Thiamine ABC transporter ATP-binding protein [Bosea sp. 62]